MPLPAESALVPSLADLDKWGLRAEALRSISDAAKSAALSAAFDRVLAALGKRAKRPVTFIDDWLKELVCRIASAGALGWQRGVNPRAGQDAWILSQLEMMQKDLEDIRLGRVEPYFIDSTALHEQGPRGGGDLTADAWAKCNPYKLGWPYGGGCC